MSAWGQQRKTPESQNPLKRPDIGQVPELGDQRRYVSSLSDSDVVRRIATFASGSVPQEGLEVDSQDYGKNQSGTQSLDEQPDWTTTCE